MSYDTNKTYAYIYSGKKIRLYKIVRSAGRIIDNQGRVSGGLLDDIIYPDENITNGLRIEFTKIIEPFVVEDPEATSSLTEDTSPSESSHLNLNRVLSLAVVCYVKAQLAKTTDLGSRGHFRHIESKRLAHASVLSLFEVNNKTVLVLQAKQGASFIDITDTSGTGRNDHD